MDYFNSDMGSVENMWHQDRAAMEAGHWSGIMKNFTYEDFIIEESMGPIADRTSEYLGTSDAHSFDLDKSFEVLFIVLIGGSASLFGNFLGAAFIVLTPVVLTRIVEWIDLTTVFDNGVLVNFERLLFGVIIIILLIREPDGLASLLQRSVARWRVWPLRA